MIPKIYFIILIFFTTQNTTTSIDILGIHGIKSVENFIKNLTNKINHDFYEPKNASGFDKNNIILKNILFDLTDILENLNEMESDLDEYYWSTEFHRLFKTFQEYSIKKGFSEKPFMPLVARIEETRRIINAHAEAFISFRKSNSTDNLLEFCPFFTGVLSFLILDYKARSIASLYKNFIDNIFHGITDKIFVNFCGQISSLREGIFKFYRLAMIPYLKEFAMYWFIDIATTRCQKNSAIEFLLHISSIFGSQFSQNIQLTKDTIRYLKFFSYRCDASDAEKYNREPYYELEQMIQTIIIDEKYINTMKSCGHNCNLSSIENSINRSDCKEFRDCKLIGGSFDVCEVYRPYNSRRYQWFHDNNGVVYGDSSNQQCYERRHLSSYFVASEFRYCDYCMCTCIKKQKRGYHIVTAISFRDQVSNIDDNMVVMGVRFVRQDYMIHVQIKEGKLGQIGYNLYDPWKELENFDYNPETDKYLIKNLNGSATLTMGIDYGHPEAMNFDDLIAPEGFVITGVRFRFARDSLDLPGFKSNPVELQIRVSPFDYFGKKIINHDQTHWMSPEQKHERDELVLNEPDIPTKSSENLIDSSEGQFIRFRASDLRKDAGQSTVPFFDAMEAEGYPGFPLGGIGIIHRGRKGFGGYLAFKILDLDLSHYFKDDLFR